jgi:hypothetical protein
MANAMTTNTTAISVRFMHIHGIMLCDILMWMTENTPEGLEQQIADLQRQLENARTESGGDTSAPYERQEVHEVIGEQIQQAGGTEGFTSPPPSDVPGYQDPALMPQVQQLVNVAFTKSVAEAISEARKTGNAALIDAFHDILTDQLHEELLKRQKIQPAA